MKKSMTLMAILILVTAVACTQKSETTVETDSSGSASSTYVESSTSPAVDTAATAEMKADAQEAAADAKEAANDAAHATGTAMETAGKKIQEKTETRTETTKTDTHN